MSHSDRIYRTYRRWLRNLHGENGQFARRTSPTNKKPLRTSVAVRADKETSDETSHRKRVISVWMLRNEAADNDLGGVFMLEEGDLYWRDSEFDDATVPYAFTGTILEQGKHYTIAEFQRFRNLSQGRGVI